MNRRLFITGGVIIGILALVGVWKFLGQEKAGSAAKQKKPLPLVAVQDAKIRAISRTVALTGSVTATQAARLASPGEGPVLHCRVREGDAVKRGQRLVTIGRSGAAAAQVTASAEALKEQQAELNRVKSWVIGVLIVVAATVNEGVLLLTFAEELGQRDRLSPLDAVIAAAKIRLRPRAMISFAIIFGFIPLALNLEEGGEMLQPMAAGAIGGLTLGILVALFMMPCLYVIFAGKKQ